jgi:hypothetical protein
MSQSVEHKSHQYLCTMCVGEQVEPARVQLLKDQNKPITCKPCGNKLAILKAAQYTIAPMHKSNYMLITNLEDLKGLNNKGGLIK